MKRKQILATMFLATAVLIFVLNNSIYAIPKDFKTNSSFEVSRGDSIYSISEKLEEEGYINSASLFRLISIYKNKNLKIAEGVYDFKESMNMWEMITKFTKGKSDRSSIVLTVPEGFTNLDIANRLSSITADKISKEEFLNLAKPFEGRLFPDTYYLNSSDTAESVLEKMLKEFDEKIGNVNSEDIVFASILEGEAKSREDMQMVSGILKERLRLNMALQVDVAPITYKERGLPKYPINNPGENAFYATRYPTASEYLYYITGDDGKMYYAKDFATHKKNIAKYLK